MTGPVMQWAAPVALLGQTVVNNLFSPDEDPLGATLRIKNFPIRVIGVLAAKGQSTFGQDQDDLVMVPFSTAETKGLGVAAPTQPAATRAIFLTPPSTSGIQPPRTGRVIAIPQVGGFHHRYQRLAA